MPLNPPPTISSGLGLVVQKIQRSDSSVVAEVTFSLAVAGTPSLAVAQDAIDDFQAAFQTMYSPLSDSAALQLQPEIRLGDGSTVPFEAVAAGAAVSGSNSSAMTPPQVCALVKKTTGVGGRANRGRTYFPYMLQQNAVNETGQISSGTLSAFQASLNTFLAQLATDGIPLCISNKIFNQALPPHHVTSINFGNLVTAYNLEQLVATQRRRLGR